MFDLEGTVPIDRCRLVKYDDFYEALERSFEGMEETSMGQLLGGVRQSYLYDLLLESRSEGEEFDMYTPNGCTLEVCVSLDFLASQRGISVAFSDYNVKKKCICIACVEDGALFIWLRA